MVIVAVAATGDSASAPLRQPAVFPAKAAKPTNDEWLNKFLAKQEQRNHDAFHPQPSTAKTPPSSDSPASLASQPATNPQAGVQKSVSSPTKPDSVDEQAFAKMATQLLPLTPTQIHKLHQMFAASQAAAAASPGIPPKPTATTQLVNLAPGSTPPVIRLGQGFVSSVVFVDATGAPWPIVNYDIGNPQAFNIVWNKKDNTLMIQAEKAYVYGNLAVRLKGLNTPVMITLIPAQRAVDYRVDMRLPIMGPNAVALPNSVGLPHKANSELLTILDGVAPKGGMRLHAYGAQMQAWARGNTMFIRSRDTVLSPSWQATMASPDGMHVYEMQRTPVVLVSVDGNVRSVKLEDK